MASLAQAEATLELVDRFKNGIGFPRAAVDALEMFSVSADRLASRMPDR